MAWIKYIGPLAKVTLREQGDDRDICYRDEPVEVPDKTAARLTQNGCWVTHNEQPEPEATPGGEGDK